jgi:hypothetical protein
VDRDQQYPLPTGGQHVVLESFPAQQITRSARHEIRGSRRVVEQSAAENRPIVIKPVEAEVVPAVGSRVAEGSGASSQQAAPSAEYSAEGRQLLSLRQEPPPIVESALYTGSLHHKHYATRNPAVGIGVSEGEPQTLVYKSRGFNLLVKITSKASRSGATEVDTFREIQQLTRDRPFLVTKALGWQRKAYHEIQKIFNAPQQSVKDRRVRFEASSSSAQRADAFVEIPEEEEEETGRQDNDDADVDVC